MKFLALLAAAVTVLASPLQMERRQSDLVAITDKLLYSTSLPDFVARRNARDPPSLDWTSDGCTSSPDNPLGFPFTPACNRHDFGYQNYRIQSRFTQSNKFNIDNNFLLEYVFFFLFVSLILSTFGQLCCLFFFVWFLLRLYLLFPLYLPLTRRLATRNQKTV